MDRPSAWISAVDVINRAFATFCVRGSDRRAFLRFCGPRIDPLRETCVSKRSRCLCRSALAAAPCAKGRMEVVSWFARLLSESCGREFHFPLIRVPTRKSQLFSRKVVREVHFRSSSWKVASFAREAHFHSSGRRIATFKYENSTRSKLSQFRLENRNF